MKQTLILILFFLSKISLCQSISGKIIDKQTANPVKNAGVYLVNTDTAIDKSKTMFWKSKPCFVTSEVNTDSSGKYCFDSLKPANYNLYVFYQMPAIGNSSAYRLASDSNIHVNSQCNYVKAIYLNITCEFDKTRNQLFCPECKKEDEVLPIYYSTTTFEEFKAGKTPTPPEGRYYLNKNMRDLYCNASKHCERCNIDF